MNPDKTTGDRSRTTRLIAFDIQSEKVTAEYAYRLEAAKDFEPSSKTTPDEMKVSAVIFLNPTNLLILERTDLVAKLYTVDLDSEESKYDAQGNNLGKGKISQIPVISLDKPLPLPTVVTNISPPSD